MVVRLTLCIAILFALLSASTPVVAATFAYPDIGTGYSGSHKGKITFSWNSCLKDATNLSLTANRASGDKDTLDSYLVDDDLKTGWPRWKATDGSFVGGDDEGTSVQWDAPSTEQDVTFTLYEDDEVTESYNSDDTGLANYGQSQDTKTVRVTIIAVDLIIRTSGNSTNTSPGPDSRGKLGLWNNHLAGKNNMKLNCENHTTGDVVNGGASYLGGHPYAAGTGLKTEMYGHITDRAGIADATVENNTNWRIYQQRKGGAKCMGTPLPGYTTTWTDESGSPFTDSTMHTIYDIPHDYLYNEDCPRITGISGGADGSYYTYDSDFQTWISFKYSGTWHRVTPKEEWGMEAKLKKVSGSWTVEKEGTAKTY